MEAHPTLHNKEVYNEKKLLELLRLLPKELVARWQEKIDDLDTEEACVFVEDLIARRNEAKEKVFTRIHEIKNEAVKEEVRGVVRAIETTFGDANYFVGNGSVAEVYDLPSAPHVAVKYLVNPDMAREHGNNFREEMGYLEDVASFEVEGVRSPYPYFYHSSDFGTCFGMEKIGGHSLNIIIENKDKCQFLDVLRAQDMKTVIDRMKAYVGELHKTKRIVHRDLTPRNIIVNEKGEWFVIDFGRAKRIEIGDDSTDLYERADLASVESAIRELYKAIDQ